MILVFAHEFTYVCICTCMCYPLRVRLFHVQRSVFHLPRFRYDSSFHIFGSLFRTFHSLPENAGDACLEAIENIKYKTFQVKSLWISCIRSALITDLLIIHWYNLAFHSFQLELKVDASIWIRKILRIKARSYNDVWMSRKLFSYYLTQSPLFLFLRSI